MRKKIDHADAGSNLDREPFPQTDEKHVDENELFGDDKHEAVKETIDRIKSERVVSPVKKNRAAEIALRVAAVVFFPLTLLFMGARAIFKRFKIGIAVKVTVIFTVVFGLMIIGYAAFTVASIANIIGRDGAVSSDYLNRLIITSSVLVVLFIVLGAFTGWLSSMYMIRPIRKITERVNEISDENMSARLDPVDSQDELMELTEQINAMLDSLQEAFERQENFVSDASHELKTPLSVIAGYANLLRRWGKDDPQILDEAVAAISRESDNMKRIVEQLLWLAKLGKFTLNVTEFNLYEAVSDIVDGYKTAGIKHAIELFGDPSITLSADKNLITEAVRTLVDNAIKYTPPESGEINVSIRQTAYAVELDIADNGIGIAEEDCAHIFERFYRCDKVRGRESGSCGLGLTICKSIIEMSGGTVSVASEKGKGSTFKIVLNRSE